MAMEFAAKKMTTSSRELCRVKKAVKKLIKQHGTEITCPEICRELLQSSIFMGTYRNLLSQVSSVLKLLVAEGSIKEVGKSGAKAFLFTG